MHIRNYLLFLIQWTVLIVLSVPLAPLQAGRVSQWAGLQMTDDADAIDTTDTALLLADRGRNNRREAGSFWYKQEKNLFMTTTGYKNSFHI